MKVQVKGTFKSYFFHQEEKQKGEGYAGKFFLKPNIIVQQVPQPPYLAPPFFQIISQVRINKVVNKHSVNYHCDLLGLLPMILL